MLDPQLENLIELLLSDGQLTEKEKKVLYKKAIELDVDIDEFEVILEAKITNASNVNSSKSSISENKQVSNKEGVVKKCPACGASAKSFIIHCQDCGHEFREKEAVNSVKKLFSEIDKIEVEERNRERTFVEKMDGDLAVMKSIATRQSSMINAYPVPNTKEDLIEFLTIASSEANKKVSILKRMNSHPESIIQKAWYSKCEQIIKKARFSMIDDKKTLDEVESCASHLKIR
jgi:predicted RNA-binding Zn-ribbon protein involved in translation (DUF1610 family)